MGDSPTTTNAQATLGASVINGVLSVAESAALNAIIAEVPFLGVPGAKQLTEILVDYIGGKIADAIKPLVVNGVIDIQVITEESNLKSATAALQAAQNSGDPNAISQAQSQFEDAFASLGHFDGSSTS